MNFSFQVVVQTDKLILIAWILCPHVCVLECFPVVSVDSLCFLPPQPQLDAGLQRSGTRSGMTVERSSQGLRLPSDDGGHEAERLTSARCASQTDALKIAMKFGIKLSALPRLNGG